MSWLHWQKDQRWVADIYSHFFDLYRRNSEYNVWGVVCIVDKARNEWCTHFRWGVPPSLPNRLALVARPLLLPSPAINISLQIPIPIRFLDYNSKFGEWVSYFFIQNIIRWRRQIWFFLLLLPFLFKNTSSTECPTEPIITLEQLCFRYQSLEKQELIRYYSTKFRLISAATT